MKNRPSNYRKVSYLEKLSIVNRNLREGDLNRIAKKAGTTIYTAKNIVSGESMNDRIMNQAYDITRSRKPTSSLLYSN
jgi:predicted transcriptional regulator